MNFRITLFTCGILMVVMAVAMLLPVYVDLYYGYQNYKAFILSAVFVFFIGASLMIANRGGDHKLTIREGFLLTTVSWLLFAIVGALPLYFSDLRLSAADAFFESMSGITTTGSTVITQLDYVSRGVLVWRSLLQWIGGIGIVAFAIFLLPYLKIGGMQLFKTESSDRSEKAMPQTRVLVVRLVFVYVLLTGLCAIAYYELGMSKFDAINHAMTTISTGGYSTHDLSFGYFDNDFLELAAIFFMFAGGLPFVLYVKAMFLNEQSFLKDAQVVFFAVFVLSLTMVNSFWLIMHANYPYGEAFLDSLFNIVSVITTTGYATTDYMAWGGFPTLLFFFITYIGGCAGSTAGGIKIMRLLVLFEGMKSQIYKMMYPNMMITLKYQGRPIQYDLISNVLGFLTIYVLLNVFLTMALAFVGLDFETASSAAATAIANVGPGIGDVIGPAGNFSSLPDSAKWLLSFGMFVGRLEILTVFVIFSSHFWKP
ncbi:MAG: hypothetical protein GC137_06785 [Alphaproteobacteria bacterium]|nr:hypothetical protein [Alphaproteobacteria bacterium]